LIEYDEIIYLVSTPNVKELFNKLKKKKII